MPRNNYLIRCVILALFILIPLSLSSAQTSGTLSGVLTVVHGGDQQSAVTLYRLTTSAGERYTLDIAESVFETVGGKYNVLGQNVTVTYDHTASRGAGQSVVVSSLTRGLSPRSDFIEPAATVEKWANLMCKFNGDNSAPVTRTYIENFYGSGFKQIAHYWNELSRGQISVTQTSHAWRTLPYSASYYVNNFPLNSSPNYLDKVFDDCVSLFDADINFANNYNGIAILVNNIFSSSQNYAWGGGQWTTIDGVTKLWNVIWMPPWAFKSHNIWAHEMGHAYGLPHSNNSDNDGNPYDNPWDVMSDSWSSTHWDATYGTIPMYTLAYHIDLLGWMPASKKVTFTEGEQTITLDSWYYQGSPNHHMIYIPTSESTGFTVEARKRVNGNYTAYEDSLRDDGIIIHSINQNRWEDAWLINPGSKFSVDDDRRAWKPGQTYTNSKFNFSVQVLSATTNGYQVRVKYSGYDPNFVNIAPVDEEFPWSPDVSFTWGAHQEATSYRLIVRNFYKTYKFVKTLTAAELGCTATCTLDAFTFEDWKLRRNQLHTWRIKAYDVNNNVLAKTTQWGFYSSNMAPKTVDKVVPEANAVLSGQVDFVWSDDERIDEFSLEIRDANNVKLYTGWEPRANFSCNGDGFLCTKTIDDIEALTAGAPGPFKWRVLGRTDHLTGKSKGPNWFFTVGSTLPLESAPEFRK